jgi:hypothetical protein
MKEVKGKFQYSLLLRKMGALNTLHSHIPVVRWNDNKQNSSRSYMELTG